MTSYDSCLRLMGETFRGERSASTTLSRSPATLSSLKERIDSVARRYLLVSDLRHQANVLIRERKDRFQGLE
jgi:hypothetical protein